MANATVLSYTEITRKNIDSFHFDPCGAAPEGGDLLAVMELNVAALKTVFGE